MRSLLFFAVIACGGVMPSEDGGTDGGKMGPPFAYSCRGYFYCPLADGGRTVNPVDFTTCRATTAEANADRKALTVDAGSTCYDNGGCTEGGACE